LQSIKSGLVAEAGIEKELVTMINSVSGNVL